MRTLPAAVGDAYSYSLVDRLQPADVVVRVRHEVDIDDPGRI